jgi:hypothetical protein
LACHGVFRGVPNWSIKPQNKSSWRAAFVVR